MTIVCTFTLVGDSETMNRPRPKKEVKISPMTASCLSRVTAWSDRIAAAASSAGEEGAGGEGQAEHVGAGDARARSRGESASPIRLQPFSIRKAERKPQTPPTRPLTQMALTM